MALEYELAKSIWEYWKKTLGYEPRRLSYMDVMNLVRYGLKECEKRGCDYQIIDFKAILDPSIGYYENKELLDDFFSALAKKEIEAEEWAEEKADEEYRRYVEEEARKLGIIEEYETKLAELERELRERPEEIAKVKISDEEVRKGIAEIDKELEEFKFQVSEFSRLFDMIRTIEDAKALDEEIRLFRPKIVAKIDVAEEFRSKLAEAGRSEVWDVAKKISDLGVLLKSLDKMLSGIQDKITQFKKEEKKAKAVFLPRGEKAKRVKAPAPSVAISPEAVATGLAYAKGVMKVKFMDNVYVVKSSDFSGEIDKSFAEQQLREFVGSTDPLAVKEYVDTKGGGKATNSLGSFVLAMAYFAGLPVKPIAPTII